MGWNEIKETIVLLFLGIHALMDVRRKEISLFLTVCALLGAWITGLAVERKTAWEMLVSLFPGFFFLLSAYVTKEKIGYGDGFFLLAFGSWLGFTETFLILTIALFLCAGVCMVRMIQKKMRRNDSVPLIPFLLFGFVGRCLICAL